MAGLSAVNPHTGLSESLLGTGLGPDLQGAIVDPAAMQLLHMNTVADPNREPTFTFFGNPNFFFETVGSTTPVVGTGLRLESRRHPAGDRAHVHRDRWPWSQESRRNGATRFLYRSR